ncbi:UNVERIFIED_CONTAM: hypothetical protein FKN15_023070 [Acipenser sinensis]
MMKPVIVVHGGAWAIPDKIAEDSIRGVKNAVLEGFKILENGGSALDAVERAVRSMEDNPVFDAGHGAVLNANGEVELDAVIMDGKTLAAGAVSSIRNISNPVTFARSVMEKEEGQAGFQGGIARVHDTVGAVALDCNGNVACATSTGGIRNKMVGRVGDTPIIGKSPEQATDEALQYMAERVNGAGGAIVISPDGNWAARFTTERMAWASIKEDTLSYGLNPKEMFNEKTFRIAS